MCSGIISELILLITIRRGDITLDTNFFIALGTIGSFFFLMWRFRSDREQQKQILIDERVYRTNLEAEQRNYLDTRELEQQNKHDIRFALDAYLKVLKDLEKIFASSEEAELKASKIDLIVHSLVSLQLHIMNDNIYKEIIRIHHGTFAADSIKLMLSLKKEDPQRANEYSGIIALFVSTHYMYDIPLKDSLEYIDNNEWNNFPPSVFNRMKKLLNIKESQ